MVLSITSLLLILLFSTLSQTNSLSFYHNQGKKCFEKYLSKDENVTISYAISGQFEGNYEVTFGLSSNENQEMEMLFDGKEIGKKEMVAEQSNFYLLCFNAKTNNYNTVTFEFVGKYDSGHTLRYGIGEVLNEMQKGVLNIQNMFEKIERNVKFLTERYGSHSNVINEFNYNLKLFAMIKVLLVIVVSAIQLFVISRFLSKRQNKISQPSSFKSFEF